MARVWLLQAFGDDRQYAGNLGYFDDPRRVYSYDSFVPNFRRLMDGDLAVLRSPDMVLGVARLERIEATDGTKTRLRCPSCGDSGIKERILRRPRYRCNTGHEFDTPSSEQVACTVYTAHFGDSFVACRAAVSASAWKGASERYNGQLAMQQIDGSRLEPKLGRRLDAAFLQIAVPPGFLGATDALGEPQAAYSISGFDERDLVAREIRARRGQASFRRDLLQRFGGRCAISGCGIVDLLEAAHISPYRGARDHHPENGLLLRADLHTLFDLDLLGVEPGTQKVHLGRTVAGHGYASFADAPIQQQSLSRPALESRWARFRRRLGNGQ